MPTTIQVSVPENGSYANELDYLRKKLDGKPYCKGVKELLPERTDWQIRNIVNGRGEDKLILQALRIYVHKQEAAQREVESRLAGEAIRAGLEEA